MNRHTILSVLTLLSITIIGVGNACMADCIWSAEAHAWLDQNQNGSWDPEEKPLAGVQFVLDDVRNNFKDVSDEAISDTKGTATILVWMPGCPNYKFELSAVPPQGYQPTTPSRLALVDDLFHHSSDQTYSFGFFSSTVP